MSNLEDLERRLAALEQELPLLREEAAAARALAAGADRDVAEYRAEMRAHSRVLGALRETQIEHYDEHKRDAHEIKQGISTIVQMLERLADGTNGDQ